MGIAALVASVAGPLLYVVYNVWWKKKSANNTVAKQNEAIAGRDQAAANTVAADLQKPDDTDFKRDISS